MLNNQNITLSKDAIIKKALEVIDSGGLKIAVVLDKNKKFFGMLSDGDIRRGLINGLNVQDKITTIINKNCIFVDKNVSNKKLDSLFKSNDIDHIPVVDENKNFLGLKTSQTKQKNEDFIAFISAGGQGLRLRPLTNDIPKPLVEVNEVPIIRYIVDRFIKHDTKKIYISINYLGHKIVKYFQKEEFSNVEIIFLEEKKKLGTIGALSLIEGVVNKPLLVINSDIVSNFNINDLLLDHKQNLADMTVGVRNYDIEIPFGIFDLNKKGRIISVKEKPTYSFASNSGIYVISPKILKELHPNTKLDATDLIEKLLIQNKKINSYFIHEYWRDIGTHDQLKLVEIELKRNNWS